MFEITNRRRRRPSQDPSTQSSSTTSRQSKSARSTTLLLIFGLASLLFYDDLLSIDTSFYDYIEGVDYEESVDSYDGETQEVDNINRRLRVLDKEKQAKKRADVVATRTVVNKKGQVVERPVISALDFFSRAVAPKNDGTNVKEDLTNEQVEQEKLGQSVASSFEAWDNNKDATSTAAAPKVQEIPKDLIPVDVDIDQYGDEENTIVHPKSNAVKKAASKAVNGATRYQDQESSSATAGFNPAAYNPEDTAAVSNIPPLSVCERLAPISHEKDLQILSKYKSQCTANKSKTPQDTSLLLLEGVKTYGRTGNNLIEFLHAMQYAKDYGHTVAIKHGSWPIQRLITDMWMSVQDDVRSRHSSERQEKMKEWYTFFEEQFCVQMISPEYDLSIYKDVIRMDTKDLFMFQHDNSISNFDEYVEYQGYLIRTLFRHYNKGYGVNLRNQPVKDMCSVLDTMFVNQDMNTIKYSVIHSRSLEGEPGKFLLGRIAEFSGCDDQAALDMTPEYIKSILTETDMLNHPIIFITDGQRPEILERLLADPDIGPQIHLIPEETSWVGGDITIAITSTVFIGNPASTFSGFIAKSRVALGFDKSYLFRKKDGDTGKWTDVCGRNCIYNKAIMRSMS